MVLLVTKRVSVLSIVALFNMAKTPASDRLSNPLSYKEGRQLWKQAQNMQAFINSVMYVRSPYQDSASYI